MARAPEGAEVDAAPTVIARLPLAAPEVPRWYAEYDLPPASTTSALGRYVWASVAPRIHETPQAWGIHHPAYGPALTFGARGPPCRHALDLQRRAGLRRRLNRSLLARQRTPPTDP